MFDFREGEDQPHATMPIPPVGDEPRDAHQFKHLALLKVCNKYHIEILWLRPTLLLMRLNFLSP